MRVHVGVLMQGQGHLNRAAALVRRLRARGHEVSVLLAGATPPAYAEAAIGPFEHLEIANLVVRSGELDAWASARVFLASMPARFAAVRGLARRLARARVDLVLSDFEPVSALAARVAGVPAAGIAGQYRLTRTDAAGPPAGLTRLGSLAFMESFTPGLARYFAVTFSPARATRPRTLVVDPIVDDAVRDATPSSGGFTLAYLYAYPLEQVLGTLQMAPGSYRVYGLDRDEVHGNVTLARTDRAAFVRDLAACDGVILNGSFQGVCEAAVLQKPILSIPFAGQYEELFNAHLITRSGLGLSAPRLTTEAVTRFVTSPPAPRRAPVGDGAAQVIEALGL